MPSGLVVDVVDHTGRAVTDRVRADLEAGGVTVGTVTSGPGGGPSAIEYPAADESTARRFAHAIDAATYLRQADVGHLTVVLGPGDDAAALLTALDRFTACSTAGTPTSTSTAVGTSSSAAG